MEKSKRFQLTLKESKEELTQTGLRKKVFLTFLLGILLSLLYVVIFSLSDQDAEESANLSMEITERCVDAVMEMSGKEADVTLRQKLVAEYEKFVRKIAHFSEYAGSGILIYLILSVWYVRDRKRIAVNMLWVFVSAVFDEIHQYFIPGRFSSPLDVLIDTMGGAFGVLMVCFALWAAKKIQQSFGYFFRYTT